VTDLESLELTICELLYTTHTQKDAKLELDKSQVSKWCMQIPSKDPIFKSESLYFILGDEEEVKQKVDSIEAEALEDQFKDMQLTENDDQVGYDEVQVLIKERLYQLEGHLFKYDSEQDKNLLVAQDVFLCVDRMGDKRHHFIIHATDKA
jgi:hypothetical protein